MVYLKADGMSVVFANGGQEAAGRYLVYHYRIAAEADTGPTSTNTLPLGTDAESIRLPGRTRP
jgi:hypothetical protein